MEKPTKIEVGQRWQYGRQQPVDVIGVDDCFARMTLGFTATLTHMAKHWTFLGYAPGYGPTVDSTEAVITAYQCSDDNKNWMDCECRGYAQSAHRYQRMKATAAGPTVAENDAAHEAAIARHEEALSGFVKPRALQREEAYRGVGEMRATDGSPRTALEAIQARKPPEPWVPSCDELHWLKDA